MKKLLSLLIVILLTAEATAQTPVKEQQARQMMEQIGHAAQAMKTMQCTFKQTKTLRMMKSKMVSKGRMCYTQPSQLRWEYTSPYQYIFIVNGSKVYMKSGRQTNVVDANKNKVFRQITQIMMSSVTGKSLTDCQNFKTEMLVSGTNWIARLIPLKKELKQIFTQFVITFDTKRMIATRVEMFERGGDTTTIELLNPTKNVTVSQNEYKIN